MGREVVHGETVGTDRMRGMWGTTSGLVNVELSDDLKWESGWATTHVDPPDGKRGQDVQDVLPDEGGPVVMSRGGVPGGPGNEDGNAGALRAPECPRHRGDAGGRKLPPPTVCQVRHAGSQEGAQWAPPGDRAVCKRS